MAKRDFELKLGLEIFPAGLFIDKISSFLACSPDGLIGDKDLLEVKCPYSAKDMTVIEGVATKKNQIFVGLGRVAIEKDRYLLLPSAGSIACG